MPTLLELQHAMRRSLVADDNEAIAEMLDVHVGLARLDIYRNTIFSGLTKALRLSYPVVQRLVGADFFEGAAQLFIAEHPPGAAYLDQYGGELSDFLRHFPPAASVAYLADVARLEWAVNCAIHAPDIEPLDLSTLAIIEPNDLGRVSFVAHPSIRLLRADYPVEVIWRAVLAGDDGVLATLDINSAPVHLLVERRTAGVEVFLLDEPAWHFLADLCAGRNMKLVLESAADFDPSAALAEHLAAGRFVAFELTAPNAAAPSHEVAA